MEGLHVVAPQHEPIAECMQADWILCSAHIRLGSTSIRVEGSHFLLVALGFIDKSVSIRSLLRFVRPLRHSVLVQEDEVIDGC